MMLRGPRPLSMFQELAKDLSILVLWFQHEGVLDGFVVPSQTTSSTGLNSKCRGSAATGNGTASTEEASSGTAPSGCGPCKVPDKTAADPEEVAACRMLTLGVLARVLITYCQLLPFPSCSTGRMEASHSSSRGGGALRNSSTSKGGLENSSSTYSGLGVGSRDGGLKNSNSSGRKAQLGNNSTSSANSNGDIKGMSSSGHCNSSETCDGYGDSCRSPNRSSDVPCILENFRASSLSTADVPWLLQAGLLGVVCYRLLKQLTVEDGISTSSSSNSSGACRAGGSGSSNSPGVGSSSNSSRGKDGGGCREGASGRSPAVAARQKWGRMQRQLPASLLQALQTFESVIQGPLQQEWAWAGTLY